MAPFSKMFRVAQLLFLVSIDECKGKQFDNVTPSRQLQRLTPKKIPSREVVNPTRKVEVKSYKLGKATTLLTSMPRGGGEDYSSAAQGLFGNIIGPASMLTGGLVPLGFAAPALPKDHPKLKSFYNVVAVLSLANVILAIIYGTVSCNKIVEVPPAPASSVFELLQRDYELSWIGTNVHFIGSLSGFLIMVAIRAYSLFPDNLRIASAGITTSVLLMSLSIINRGITRGDGSGNKFGKGTLTLMIRYCKLLGKQLVSSTSGPVEVLAVLLFLGSVALAIRGVAVVSKKDTEQKRVL